MEVKSFQNIDWNVLLRGAKGGDEVARERLFAELWVRLRSVCQSKVRGWSKEDVDDIVQNALVVVHMKLGEIVENPHHFALNVLRKKIGDAIRARAKGPSVSIREEWSDDSDFASLQLIAPEYDLDEAIDRHQHLQRILKVIPQLSKFCQAYFTAVFEGLTTGDVWDLALASEPALKRSAFDKRLWDCKDHLQKKLGLGGKS